MYANQYAPDQVASEMDIGMWVTEKVGRLSAKLKLLPETIVQLAASLASNCTALRVPLIVAGIGYFAFGTPDQIQELYLILASDVRDNLFKIVSFGLIVTLLCFSISQCARQIFSNRTASNPTGLQVAIAGLIGVLPAVGIAVGLHRSAGYFGLAGLKEVLAKLAGTPVSPDVSSYLGAVTGNFPEFHAAALFAISTLQWTAVVAVIASAGFVLFESMSSKMQATPWWFRFIERNIFFVSGSLVVVWASQSLSSLKAISSFLITLSASAGTLTWLAMFLVVLLFFLIRLQGMSHRAGLSITGLLVLCALIFDWAGLNDNHTVRTIASDPKTDSGGLIQDEFSTWWEQRPPERVNAFTGMGKPFPVYVVAARGGGIYAAYQTAVTLARLYDRCPAIIDHIFLISSVSGGSVGAAAFSAAVQTLPAADKSECSYSSPTSPGKVEVLLNRFFASDFLSPLAASAFFPDFAQRFLPYPISAFDRARAFERALEVAWVAASGGSDAFSKGINQHRNPGSGPILFMNVTQAETGEQHVVAPTTDTIQWGRSGVTSADLTSMGTDIALSTAATLSSRFPMILPPASVSIEREPGQLSPWPRIITRYVDGGYFENSGAETAMNVVQWLEGETPAKSVSKPGSGTPDPGAFPEYLFKLIVLGHSGYSGRLYEGAQFEPNSFSELLTPVDAFMQTREVRGDLAVERATQLLNSSAPSNAGTTRIYNINLNHRFFKFPLGWQLSSITRKLIAANVSDAGICNIPGQSALYQSALIDGPNMPSGMTGFINSFADNACVQCSILKDIDSGLRPQTPRQTSDKAVEGCSGG